MGVGGAGVVVGGDEREPIRQAQGRGGGSGVNGEEGIEVVAHRGELEAPRTRGRPSIPERGPAGEIEDARFAGFPGAIGVSGGDAVAEACERDGVGESIIGGDGAEIEEGEAGGGTLAVHGDLIRDPGLGGEIDTAGEGRTVVVVGGDEREGGHGVAGVNGENGIVGAAGGAEADGGGGGGRPFPPQRSAAIAGGGDGFAGLGSGAGVVRADKEIIADEAGALGEVIVEGPIGRRGKRAEEVEAGAVLRFAGVAGDGVGAAQQAIDELAVGVGREMGLEQGEGAGDVGCGHRGAGEGGGAGVVGVADRENALAGGEQIDRRAVIGKR